MPDVIAWTDLEVCRNYGLGPVDPNETTGCKVESCRRIHICKYYLYLGSCRFKDDCNQSHSLTDDHNKQLLRFYDLDEIPVADLRILFQV